MIMSSEELEKKIRESFEAERAFPFDEAAWDDLSSRIDNEKKKRAWWPLWWPRLGALGFLLASTGWLLTWLYFHSAVPTKPTQTMHTYLLTDTVTTTRYVYVRDTVWNTREIIHYVPVAQKGSVQGVVYPSVQTPRQTGETTASDPLNTLLQKANTTPTTPVLPAGWPQYLPPALALNSPTTAPELPIQPKPIQPVTKAPMRRWSVSIGWENAWLPKEDSIYTQAMQSPRFSRLMAGIEYAPLQSLRILAGAGFERISYASKTYAPAPWTMPAPLNYELDTFQLLQTALHYRLGWRYLPLHDKFIQPVVGMQLLGRSDVKEQTFYNFNPQSPYLPEELTENAQTERKKLEWTHFTIDAGLRIRLAPPVSLELLGQYYRPIQDHPDWNLNLGVRGNLLFHF